jgi:hypothetical protein
MSDENIEPYDFSALDAAVYDPMNPASFAQIAASARVDVSELHERAWADVELQTTDDVNYYLKKYLIAQWRSFEMEHVENVIRRQGRGLPIRRAAILSILLRSDEVDEDFLDIASQHTRDEMLQKITEASAPWLSKYKLRLDYNSVVDYRFSTWEIFMDAQME